MKRIGIACLLILGAGCAHVGLIPAPTREWQYEETTEEQSELLLRVSILITGIGQIRTHEAHLRRSAIPAPGELQGLMSSRRSASAVCADGPSGWCNSTVSVRDATPTGVAIWILCSYSEHGQRGHIDQEINVPYTRSGQKTAGDVTYSWKWVEIKRPNQASHATSEPAPGAASSTHEG